MPVSECSLRNRNDVPTPARSGATPGLIFEGTDWADDAKGVVPYLIRSEEANLSLCWLAEWVVKKALAVIDIDRPW